MERTLCEEFAIELEAMQHSKKLGNESMVDKLRDSIVNLCDNHLPSGAGFDDGSALDFDRSTPDRLVFYTSFHHMDEVGYYDGWTDHDIVVTPSLTIGFDMEVTGPDKNGILDYIAETFTYILEQGIDPTE